MVIYIYILIDPRTQAIRYVGQTIQELRKRIYAHSCVKGGTHINNWIRQLLGENLRPIGKIVDTAETIEEANQLEIEYIQFYRDIGCKLVNMAEGGTRKGVVSAQTKEKMRLAHLGKKHTTESRQKIGAKHKGRLLSEKQQETLRLGREFRKTLGITTQATLEQWQAARELRLERYRKLTNQQVQDIRMSTESVKELSIRYKISVSSIYDVRAGRTYVHVV